MLQRIIFINKMFFWAQGYSLNSPEKEFLRHSLNFLSYLMIIPGRTGHKRYTQGFCFCEEEEEEGFFLF